MSVSIVSHKHVDGLLTFAIANRVTFEAGEPRRSVTVTALNATVIGRALLRENAAAWSIAYPLEAPDTSASAYRFAPWKGPALQPLEIRGGCACLDYQCTGLARWYRVDPKRALDAIGAAAHALCPPATKDTAWDLDTLADRPAPRALPPSSGRGNVTRPNGRGPLGGAPARVPAAVSA